MPITEEFFSTKISGRYNPDICRDLFPHYTAEQGVQFSQDKEARFCKLAGMLPTSIPKPQYTLSSSQYICTSSDHMMVLEPYVCGAKSKVTVNDAAKQKAKNLLLQRVNTVFYKIKL